jgi:hypothetical protein
MGIESYILDKEFDRRNFLDLSLKSFFAFSFINYFSLTKSFAGSYNDDDNKNINSYLSYFNNSVEENLVSLDYSIVYNSIYDDCVYQKSKVEKKPIMVLFYLGDESSRGLSALFRVIGEKYSSIERGVFLVSEKNEINQNYLNNLNRRYGINKVPSLLFYKIRNDKVSKVAQFTGGISSYSSLVDKVNYYSENLPRLMELEVEK